MSYSKPLAAVFCLVVISILLGISFESAAAQEDGSDGGVILFARRGTAHPTAKGCT